MGTPHQMEETFATTTPSKSEDEPLIQAECVLAMYLCHLSARLWKRKHANVLVSVLAG